jgi:hypothetical protein
MASTWTIKPKIAYQLICLVFTIFTCLILIIYFLSVSALKIDFRFKYSSLLVFLYLLFINFRLTTKHITLTTNNILIQEITTKKIKYSSISDVVISKDVYFANRANYDENRLRIIDKYNNTIAEANLRAYSQQDIKKMIKLLKMRIK